MSSLLVWAGFVVDSIRRGVACCSRCAPWVAGCAMLLFGLSATEVRASDLLKRTANQVCRLRQGKTVSGLPFWISGIRRRLLQPRQPQQSHGARLRFRQEGRPGRRDGREQPIPRSGKDQAGVRIPAREHGQSAGRLRRSERPVPGAERGDRTRGQAPVHRLVRWARLAHHPGRGDRQVGQGLRRRERLGAGLSRLLGQRFRSVWFRGDQSHARQEHPGRGSPARFDSVRQHGGRLRRADCRPQSVDARSPGQPGPGLFQGAVGRRGRSGGGSGGRQGAPCLYRLVAERRGARQRGEVLQQRAQHH